MKYTSARTMALLIITECINIGCQKPRDSSAPSFYLSLQTLSPRVLIFTREEKRERRFLNFLYCGPSSAAEAPRCVIARFNHTTSASLVSGISLESGHNTTFQRPPRDAETDLSYTHTHTRVYTCCLVYNMVHRLSLHSRASY